MLTGIRNYVDMMWGCRCGHTNLAIILNKGHFDWNEACSMLIYDQYSCFMPCCQLFLKFMKKWVFIFHFPLIHLYKNNNFANNIIKSSAYIWFEVFCITKQYKVFFQFYICHISTLFIHKCFKHWPKMLYNITSPKLMGNIFIVCITKGTALTICDFHSF